MNTRLYVYDWKGKQKDSGAMAKKVITFYDASVTYKAAEKRKQQKHIFILSFSFDSPV